MKKAVWKYVLPLVSEPTRFDVPKGSQLLCVRDQYDHPVVYFEVPAPQTDEVERVAFRIMGTGWDFDPTGLIYVGSVVTQGGSFVWHVYREV